jgi:hypothetical protein
MHPLPGSTVSAEKAPPHREFAAMTSVHLVAASLAAGTTFGLLWAVISIAEPQRSSLQARLHPPEPKASEVVARSTAAQAASPRAPGVRPPREDM